VTNVYVLRVTDPTSAAQWAGWTQITSDGREQTGVCLLTVGSTIRLLYQQGSTSAVRYVESSTSGQSWSAPASLFDPGHPCYGIAADGDLGTVFVAYDPLGLGSMRLAAWQNSAGWSGVDWTNGDIVGISGIAASRNGDGSYGVVIATQNLSGSMAYALLRCLYTPGGAPAWSTSSVIQSVDTAVGVAIRYPHLTQFDGLYRLTFLEQDTGSTSGLVYTRVARAASPDFVHWQAGTPDLAATPHGAVWLKHAAGQLLVAPETVRLAPAYNPATGYRDLTGDLLRLDLVEREGEPARLVATLDNSTGAYTGLAALVSNAQILLSQGYLGAGLVPTHLLYLNEWTFARAADEHSVTLTAYDASRRLTRQTRYPLTYINRSVGYIIGDLVALAGFEGAASIDASAQFGQNVALYQLTPGQNYLAALQRLLAGYDGGFSVRAVPGSGPAFAVVDLPAVTGKSAGQPIVWSYSGEPEHLHLTHAGDRANHLIVYGPQKIPTAVAEVWDAADLVTTGQERYALLVEQLAGGAAAATLAAGLALARETRLATRVDLAVAPHPGLELFDAITVNDTAIPVVNCRIIGLALAYYPRIALHDLVLTCEGM
jgi:hypothetical protein